MKIENEFVPNYRNNEDINNFFNGSQPKEGEMKIFIFISFILTGGLTLAAILILLFKEGLVEVNPRRAWVYKNLVSGEVYALRAGLHLIIPGVHKKLVEVTLENEPSDPQIAEVITADGVAVEADYVIYTQRVREDDKSIIRAATVINYSERRKLIIERIKARLLDSFSGMLIDELFSRERGRLNKEILAEAEREINETLRVDIGEQWGIEVDVQLQNVILPEKLKEVAEEAATAIKEGERIRDKAEAAGVSPTIFAIGDIVYDIFRSGGKKEKKGEKK